MHRTTSLFKASGLNVVMLDFCEWCINADKVAPISDAANAADSPSFMTSTKQG